MLKLGLTRQLESAGPAKVVLLINLTFVLALGLGLAVRVDPRPTLAVILSLTGLICLAKGRLTRLVLILLIAFWFGLTWEPILDRPVLVSSSSLDRLAGFFDQARDHFIGLVRQSLPEPQASLASGIAIGGQTSLPDDLVKQFRATGTIHIIAVSGSNLTIILKLASDWLPRLGQLIGFWLGSFGLISFVLLTGSEPSIVRAGVLGWLFLLARSAGRVPKPIHGAALAAALMAIQEPQVVSKAGFQLSFLAFAGLVYIDPILKQGIDRLGQKYRLINRVPAWLVAIVSATLGAQLAVMPLIIYRFGELSSLSPIANALVLPVVPFILSLVLVAGLIGFVLPGLTQFLLLLAYPALSYILYITESLASWPGAAYSLATGNLLILFLGYGGLGFLIYRQSFRTSKVRMPPPKSSSSSRLKPAG